jgi:protein phosphatase
MKFTGHTATDAGPRAANQDRVVVDDQHGIYILSDGMGGHQAGQLAAQITVDTAHAFLLKEIPALKGLEDPIDRREKLRLLMRQAALSACEMVYQCGSQRSDARGMGSTLTALFLIGNEAFVAHVGDSRLYLERSGKRHQLTRDHTAVQEMIDRGAMSPAQMATSPFSNVLSRAIGVNPFVQVDLLHFDVLPGDCFILCSDGVLITEGESILLPEVDVATDLSSVPSEMIRTALGRGGSDNATVVLVAVEAAQEEQEEQEIRKVEVGLKIESLRGMYMFQGLGLSALVRIADMAYVRYLRKGEAVFREGDDDRSIYLILIGELEVGQAGCHVNTLRQGNHFGEMALLANRNRAFDVIAVRETKLLQIREADFRRLIQSDPVLGVKLLSEISKELGRRLYVSTRVDEPRRGG